MLSDALRAGRAPWPSWPHSNHSHVRQPGTCRAAGGWGGVFPGCQLSGVSTDSSAKLCRALTNVGTWLPGLCTHAGAQRCSEQPTASVMALQTAPGGTGAPGLWGACQGPVLDTSE